MLHPSYTDLMQVVNQEVEEGDSPVVSSRYSIVLATSKRARQIIDGCVPYVDCPKDAKPLSVAVAELNSAKVKILSKNAKAAQEENPEGILEEEENLEKEESSEEISEKEENPEEEMLEDTASETEE